jgi:hypothetical protein
MRNVSAGIKPQNRFLKFMKRCCLIQNGSGKLLHVWLTACRNYPGVFLLMFLLVNPAFLQGQEHDANQIRIIDAGNSLKEVGTLPKQINEASGLEKTSSHFLWTHNDGGLPFLYCIDSTGSLIRSLQLNVPNSGWEDLTTDRNGNLYVGAFGNNKNDKRSLKILKIPDPDHITEKIIHPEIILYQYADQSDFPPPPAKKNFDMDAFVAKGDSLYLFSKNRTSPFTGYTKIYSLPQQPGEYKAAVVDSIFLGNGPMMDTWVTAADLSPDGKSLVLLSHQCIWLLTDFQGSIFSKGKIFRINLNHFSHKAGVCFDTDNKLFVVDELEFGLLGGKLYSLDLQQLNINPQ